MFPVRHALWGERGYTSVFRTQHPLTGKPMATKALAKLNEFLVSIRTRSQSETWSTFFLKAVALLFVIGGFWMADTSMELQRRLTFSWVDIFQVGMIIYLVGIVCDIRESTREKELN